MQLCGILRIEKNNIAKKCCQVVAFLMVILFVSITVVQAFHTHSQKVNTEQSDEGDLTYAVEKCKICEYYVHKHKQAMYLSYPPVLLMPLPTAFINSTQLYIGNYKFTLQGFTNKGPPLLLS
jgi:hypothetical protein